MDLGGAARGGRSDQCAEHVVGPNAADACTRFVANVDPWMAALASADYGVIAEGLGELLRANAELADRGIVGLMLETGLAARVIGLAHFPEVVVLQLLAEMTRMPTLGELGALVDAGLLDALLPVAFASDEMMVEGAALCIVQTITCDVTFAFHIVERGYVDRLAQVIGVGDVREGPWPAVVVRCGWKILGKIEEARREAPQVDRGPAVNEFVRVGLDRRVVAAMVRKSLGSCDPGVITELLTACEHFLAPDAIDLFTAQVVMVNQLQGWVAQGVGDAAFHFFWRLFSFEAVPGGTVRMMLQELDSVFKRWEAVDLYRPEVTVQGVEVLLSALALECDSSVRRMILQRTWIRWLARHLKDGDFHGRRLWAELMVTRAALGFPEVLSEPVMLEFVPALEGLNGWRLAAVLRHLHNLFAEEMAEPGDPFVRTKLQMFDGAGGIELLSDLLPTMAPRPAAIAEAIMRSVGADALFY